MTTDTYRQVRTEVLNKLVLLVGIVAVPVVAFSVHRVLQIGWKPVFFIHLIFVPIAILAAIFRESIRYQVKVIYLLSIFYLTSVLAYINFPMTGHGLEFQLLFVLIAVVFMGRKNAIIMIAITAITVTSIGVLSVLEILDPVADRGAWATPVSMWINTISAFSMLMVIVVVTIASIGRILNEKLIEIGTANDRLKLASKEIKTLRGIVPICASCKNIRDDDGYWHRVDVYVRDHTDAEFSHGICPECSEKLYRKILPEKNSKK